MVREKKADVVIIGGSLGGCAAALAAARLGKTVILTEETEWIGGQLTSQAVPPDEHWKIEQYGCTGSYRQFRDGVRAYYRRNLPLTPEAAATSNLNPGNAKVSRVSHDPRVALAVLQEMLAPYTLSGKLVILTRCVPESAEMDGDRIRSITVRNVVTGTVTVASAPYFLDATDCGELLPLTGTEYVTGAESRNETGERHALEGPADPQDMQAITHCLVVDHIEGGDFTIDKPNDYEFWRSFRPDFWPDFFLSFSGVRPSTLEHVRYDLFPGGQGLTFWEGFSLVSYRRLADKTLFAPGTFDGDMTVVNWPQNDYFLGSIIDVDEAEKSRNLRRAKELSLSLLYWLQTDAPRPDGKTGYPGFRLRRDVFGTDDGLALYPYIRESRRIKAEFTILEQHVNPQDRPDGRAAAFEDSVGIGHYGLDLHPSTGNRHYIHLAALPFQIPLGSLIPIRVDNLLPACKNIGTTHITNGCYRLHPVEWNIGEASGALAAFCLERGHSPRAVKNDPALLADFQSALAKLGVELAWPSSVSVR
ncbi:FAD-dependent oxidoreductase [Paenibacillus ginsengarvi]|uniref:FAD-dependent oxidoreductase n=1 Tax=Paenibacillus ginsengarvi TaxID=400777 RepID=A0A3B0BK99_9BACL|nr:FAD-dependent oxidoreductase [Paenibacillus ginsengarvi]RKN72407.1 FAD-dependent oxidoreductase [Paenibacillus ginsengarvi]